MKGHELLKLTMPMLLIFLLLQGANIGIDNRDLSSSSSSGSSDSHRGSDSEDDCGSFSEEESGSQEGSDSQPKEETSKIVFTFSYGIGIPVNVTYTLEGAKCDP
jgi:hypothetical protein